MRELQRKWVACCLVVGGIGIALWATSFFLREGSGPADEGRAWDRDPEAPLRVEARGSGRAWQFSYSGPDGILGTGDDPVSRGHLRLPVGATIALELRSDDYIYVFSCPTLQLKEIAVPDLEFSLVFRASSPGEHDLAMDPMCGFWLPPGATMGTLKVASKSDFRQWLAGCPRLRAPPSKTHQVSSK